MYGCESWTVKKVEHQRIDAFELWCWRRLLRVPWTARRSGQSILKDISSDQSLSRVRLFATPWVTACQASLSITITQSSLRLTSIESIMPSSHLIFWCPLLLCPQSLPASGTFPMSQLFTSDDQNTGASASASVLPTSIQGWFHLRFPGLISFPRDFQESSPAPQFKGINSLVLCLLYGPALPIVHDHHSFDYTDLCQQNAVSVFNILSRFVIAFLPSSNHLRISWLQ